MATKDPPDIEETSIAQLGLLVKQRQSQDWLKLISLKECPYKKVYGWRISSRLKVPRGTKRELASSFYQLKLGHGYFKAYLKRIGRTNNDSCLCGKKETPEHLLLDCIEFKGARQRLKSQMPAKLQLPLLLNTIIGIRATLEFLKETRIATYRWRLERDQIELGLQEDRREGEEEEEGEEVKEEGGGG